MKQHAAERIKDLKSGIDRKCRPLRSAGRRRHPRHVCAASCRQTRNTARSYRRIRGSARSWCCGKDDQICRPRRHGRFCGDQRSALLGVWSKQGTADGRGKRQTPYRGSLTMPAYDVQRGDAVHPGDPVVVDRYTPGARVNHWITATCLVLLALSGLALFYPSFFFLTALFGGGQWTRGSSVDRRGIILQFFRTVSALLERKFMARRSGPWLARLRYVLTNDEERPGSRQVQRRTKGGILVDVHSDHRFDLHGHCHLG